MLKIFKVKGVEILCELKTQKGVNVSLIVSRGIISWSGRCFIKDCGDPTKQVAVSWDVSGAILGTPGVQSKFRTF